MGESMTEQEKIHMRFTAIWWGILFAAFMCLMVVTANHKTIVIADGSYGQGGADASGGQSEHERDIQLLGTEAGTGIFLIPLEKNIKAENVTVENSYMKKEMHIFIEGAKEDFYEENPIQGDVSNIQWAGREDRKKGVFLNLHMDDVYEYHTSMDGEYLRIETFVPHEMYRLLVVIDSMESGQSDSGPSEGNQSESSRSESAELISAVSRLLPKQVDREEIRLYFTDSEDMVPTEEERLAFVEAVQADLYLSIGVAREEDPAQYGIRGWYNEDYFIPEFGNVEFADIVTRKVTIACGNRAIGLECAGDDSILHKLRIPAAGVELGNFTNEQESALLSQESYREKLAQGIAEAIREVYTDYYE